MAKHIRAMPSARLRRASLWLRVAQRLRRDFLTGLATIFPVAVTLWILWFILRTSDRTLGRWLGMRIPGLGLLVTMLIILLVGVFSSNVFGRLLVPTLERWFARLPVIRRIYPALKQFARFLFSEDSRRAAFRRVALVQYPRAGLYSLAFVTNEATTSATGKSKRLVTLLVPTPPSPLTGPIILVPKEEVIMLDMSVEEAIRLVVSGGVVAPDWKAASFGAGSA